MSEELVTQNTSLTATGSDRPSFVSQGDTRGTDHITGDDLRLPRLALAQALSPQLVESDPKFIDGLKNGDIFNDLTGDIKGRGPLAFTVIRADAPRYVEFIPRSEGGGIKDPNVPANDPRTQFGPNGEKPDATKFYDFVIMLLPSREVIALSFKSSGLKSARHLNTLMKFRNSPSFAGRYTLRSVSEKNPKGTYFVLKIENDGWVSEDEFHYAEAVYESIGGKELNIQREDHEVEASFNTDEM